MDQDPSAPCRFQLRFEALYAGRRSFAFPCDTEGHVDLDQLSEALRNNYFYARAMVGRELALPQVRPLVVH
jgi:hypothetical protein